MNFKLEDFAEERERVYLETGSQTACSILDRGISLGFSACKEQLLSLIRRAVEYGLYSFEDFDADSNYDEESRAEGLREIQDSFIENYCNL